MQSKPGNRKAEECFYGAATVGERGQIVIPAGARKDIGIHPGDRLMILKHQSGAGLMLIKLETAREFMNMMLESLEQAEQHTEEANAEENPSAEL